MTRWSDVAEPQLSLRDRVRGWTGFLRRFRRLAGPYWSSEQHWHARTLTAALVALTVMQVGIPIALNLWSERFFNAIESRSLAGFLLLAGALLLIIVTNVGIAAAHLQVKRRLEVSWRKWLTSRLVGEWMSTGRHYQLSHLPDPPDNPDGRIAEDIRTATESAIELTHSLLYCVLLLISFIQILWFLSGPITIPIGHGSFFVPGHLVWVALVYAGVGTSVALLLGTGLVHAANLRQQEEADFRFGLVHARESSLPIALVRGERDERLRLSGLFQGAVRAWDRQTGALTRLIMFTSCWSVLSQVFPILISAPRYIAGTITLGALMQTAHAFQQAVAAMSWPIDNLPKVAEWRASAERTIAMHEALLRADSQISSDGAAGIAVELSDADALAFERVSIAAPDGHLLVRPFSVRIEAGERVLVTGDMAAAVTLFKAVTGVWPWGQGRIALPRDSETFFMPQRPYLPLGSLRAAVSYPRRRSYDDEEIATALRRVGLDRLADSLDETERWKFALTPGDQQRLQFARLLLHRPRWIFMQEATDAIEPEDEKRLMRLLLVEFPEATVITIGHHPALAAFHHRKLALTHTDGVVSVVERALPGAGTRR